MSTNQVFLSLKAQDRLREWFSKRGEISNVVITNVSLGDSDIDYEKALDVNNIHTLPAPYNVTGIKSHLIYSGSLAGITGKVQTFARKLIVDPTSGDEEIISLYNHPADDSWSSAPAGLLNQNPPSLSNGLDFTNLVFTEDREGYILFPLTLPDNYVDDSGNPLRLKEKYSFKINNLPLNQAITRIDNTLNAGVLITCTNHGYVDGDQVMISDIVGAEFINGLKYVRYLNSDTFNIAITSGGNVITGIGTVIKNNGTLNKWEIVIDDINSSMLIAKVGKTGATSTLVGNSDGLITIQGKSSGIKKLINFNY